MKSKVILCMLLSGILFGSVSCTRVLSATAKALRRSP